MKANFYPLQTQLLKRNYMKHLNTTIYRNLQILLLGLTASVCFAASAANADAATLTWDGGGADNNWSTAANWSPDAVPTSADTVLFNATGTKNSAIDAAFTVSAVTINDGYTGTIAQNQVLTVNGLFSQRAGTFQGTAANATFVSFSLEVGAFIAPSGTLTINGTGNYFLHNGGTYNHNNGSIVFSGGGAINFYNYNGRVYIPETFNNVTIAKQALQQSEWTVNGTLNLQSGGSIYYGIVNSYGNVNYDAGFLNGNSRLIFQGTATLGIQLPDTLDLLPMQSLNPNVTITSGNGTALTRLQELDFRQGTFQQGTAPLVINTLPQSGGTFRGSAAELTVGLTLSGGAFQGGTGTIGFTGFSQSGGTFSAQGDASASINLTGGTFNAPAGTLAIGADFRHTAGGTFNAGTGTVKFTGYSTYNCINQLVINVTTETFYNLQFDNSFCNQRYLNGTLVVNNNFRLSSGTLIGGRIRPLGTTTIDAGYSGGSGSTVVEYVTPNTNFVINNPSSTVTMLPVELNGANTTLTSSGSGQINFYGMTLLNGTLNQPNAVWSFSAFPGYTQSGGTFNGSAAQLNISNGAANGKVLTGGIFNGGTGLINGGYAQSGGTFSTQGDMNAPLFNLSGGIFNAPLGTLSIGAGFTHTAGGTFNAGTGTVQTSTVFGTYGISFDVNSTETFNNLKFNGTNNNANHIIAAGDTFIVNGTLTFNGRGVSGGSIVANGNVVYSNYGGYQNATTLVKFQDSAARTITFCTDGANCSGAYIQPTLVNNPNITINSGADTPTLPVYWQSLTLQQGTVNAGNNIASFAGDFTQSGGTFNGGAATNNFAANFALSGGDFNAAPTISFAANYTHTAGGNFNYRTGTVIFSGSGGTIDVNAGENFYNLSFQINAGNAKTIAAGDTLVSNGALSFQSGGVNGGTLNAKANVSVAAQSSGGSSNLTFSGASNQTFTNAGGLTVNGTWTVNKPNAAPSFAGNAYAPAAPTTLLLSGNIGNAAAGIFPPFSVASGNVVQTGNFSHALDSLTLASGASFVNEFGGTITLAGNLTNDGNINFDGGGSGCPQADSILIRSAAAGTQRAWSGAGAYRLVDIDLRDQKSVTGTLVVYNGTDSGNNTNFAFNGGCLAPTAATAIVGGRVTNALGRGIARTRILLVDADGATRYAATNPFGYYRFADVPVGQTVVVSIVAGKHVFAGGTRLINVTGDADDINFTSDSVKNPNQ